MQVDPSSMTTWLLSLVYGNPNAHLRKKLFSDLTSDAFNQNIPWLAIGDFNSVLCPDETSSPEKFSMSRSTEFRNWIFREGLMDLGYTGSKFTWMRGANTSAFKGAWLDRALGNVEWKFNFPNSCVQHLPMIALDHTPIMVKFESHSPIQSLADWNKSTFGNVFLRKKRLMARISGVQRAMAVKPNANLLKLDRKLRAQFEDALYQEELIWFQRSREEWLESGDHDNVITPSNVHGCFPELSEEECAKINAPFNPEDVKLAMFEMAPTKAPSPDGFTAGFYQLTWNITGICLTNFALNSLQMTSFVLKRQITDNIIVYQELLNSMNNKRGTGGWMMFKVDLEKAYDRLAWSFIEDTLQEIGFNTQWRRNIMTCVTTPRLAINCNGVHSDWFHPARGIRQGDLISPLLFALCLERLSHAINVLVNTGRWKGIKASREGPLVSHLFFADDMILFKEATVDQALEMKDCLSSFYTSSGQKMNFHKSTIFFSKNTPIALQESISSLVGIPKVEDPGKYLGVPSVHGKLKKQAFSGILERVQNKLAGWRSRTLSLAGRQVLAQSVLSTISYYSMQTMPTPAGIIDSIEKQIRGFLWGSSEGSKKIHLVSWDVVTQNKLRGGLGIRKLKEMNQAFLAKLGWRMLHEKDSLWVQLLRTKYAATSDDVSLWQLRRNMSQTWRGLLKSRHILEGGIKKVVHNGNNTLFWIDKWLVNAPLRQWLSEPIPLPDLYRNVSSYCDLDVGWLINQLINLLPEEILDKLAAVILTSDLEDIDSLAWMHKSSGEFSIKSAYDAALRSPTMSDDVKWKSIWKLKVPNRICTFIWLVKHEKILTNSNRCKRGPSECDKCARCLTAIEDTQHVLRDCPAAKEVLELVLPCLSSAANLPFEDWLHLGIKGRGGSKHPSNEATLFATTL
ncbi:PREDICTED: uncharacterized protein LOC109147346 [Ipomoea nil]|uniref:uncharacterized protein LOC109147346 n=1 Tax=Ipomoea nil TaxID=35883 RepID=UPI000900A826|nr:PREDICTED: uncharacterized protein LOC109147346 [Ipomoea nil]